MLPNPHSGQYCPHSAVSKLTPEQEDLGDVRVQSDLQHYRSTGGYKNCSYLTRKTHIYETNSHWVQAVMDSITVNLWKKFYYLLFYANGILNGLGKTRGYLGCPQAKAKLNFASQKMGQDSVKTRKIEEGTDLRLKTEKTALDWSHPGGTVVILLPPRWWRAFEYSNLFSFLRLLPPTSNSFPQPWSFLYTSHLRKGVSQIFYPWGK